MTTVAPPPPQSVLAEPFTPPPPEAVLPVINDPAWEAGVQAHFEEVSRVHPAENFTEYVNAGWQGSVSGLLVRQKAPDIVMTEDAPWYGRVAATATGVVGDLPTLIGGFVVGAPVGAAAGSEVPVIGNVAGAVLGGYAGAGGLTEATREAAMQAYTEGGIKSASDFASRTVRIAWQGFKGALTGVLMGRAGQLTKAGVATAPAAVRAVAPTAAEVATMVTAANALEGQLPEPLDFVDGAIVIGGFKSAGAIAGRLRTIYAKTGVRPEQVVADAAKDPELKKELLTEKPVNVDGVPEFYAPLAKTENAKNAVPGDSRAAEFMAQPFAEVPKAEGEPARPSHVNYNYLNTPEDVQGALSRLSGLYEQEIAQQRRGTVSWEQTRADAQAKYRDLFGREPDQAANAAELHARVQMAVDAAAALLGKRNELAAKGATATPQEMADFITMVNRTGMVVSEFLGARAETARALNMLKATKEASGDLTRITDIISRHGGPEGIQGLLDALGEAKDPAQALGVAKRAVEVTKWDKFIEYYRAALVSGLRTHEVNIISNMLFAAYRVPETYVAGLVGAMRGGPERVRIQEGTATIVGLYKGLLDAWREARNVTATAWRVTSEEGLRSGGKIIEEAAERARQKGAQETRRAGAIGGKVGRIVRGTTFGVLGVEDAFFRTLNERGTAYALATRQALKEDYSYGTKEFAERVTDLVKNPPEKMLEEVKEAGLRFTFNKPLGDAGRALQRVLDEWPVMKLVFPFTTTPGNIFKETFRRLPGTNVLVKEWKEAYEAGGARRDQAIAEIVTGGLLVATIVALTTSGHVTGNGPPSAGERRTQRAAGWQPYSFKVGDTYYAYQRLGIFGQLIGMAADSAEIYDRMDSPEEQDKLVRMLGFAFAQNVTNPFFMRGASEFINLVQEPERYGGHYVENLTASLVPGLIGQTAEGMDDYIREVNGVLEAVQARIPLARESLLPRRDMWGDPIPTAERAPPGGPITVTKTSTDKVKTEAARLGVSVSGPPAFTKLPTGGVKGNLGQVEMTPAQKDIFAAVAGHTAHELLTPMVNGPGWENLPDLQKKVVYERVFERSRALASVAALPPEQRAAEGARITEELRKALGVEPGPAQ